VYIVGVPSHHGIACPQVVDGEDGLQIWRVAANILNKQSRTADKGWSFSLGVGSGVNNSSFVNKTSQDASDFEGCSVHGD
jgi:hypothetical protein